MTREEKTQFIDGLTIKINEANIFYLADIAGLNAESSVRLRKTCFNSNVKF